VPESGWRFGYGGGGVAWVGGLRGFGTGEGWGGDFGVCL